MLWLTGTQILTRGDSYETLARYYLKQSLDRTTKQHESQIMQNHFRLIYELENTKGIALQDWETAS